MDTNTNNNENKKPISYSEFFRKRLKKHDITVKKIILQMPTSSYRKKRNYQEAFNQEPPYTRFTDEIVSMLESSSTP